MLLPGFSAAAAMLNGCGQKLLLSLLGSTLTCLLVLMAEQPRGQGLRLGGAGGDQGALLLQRGAQGLLRRLRSGETPARDPRPEMGSFGGYFSQLSRAKRDTGGGNEGKGRQQQQPPPPAREEISPRDVFIAVKTTKKFHKARLELLLDTWISRNKEMVSGGVWGRLWGGGGGAASSL